MDELFEFLAGFEFTNRFWVLVIPTVLMAIDFLTGYLGAWIKNDVVSSRMREGLVKKVGEIFILLMGKLFEYGMGLSTHLMNGISLYIMFMELISIMENLDKLNVPIPKFIKTSLRKINKKVMEEDLSKEIEDKIVDTITNRKED